MQRKNHDAEQLAMYAAAWRETLKPAAKAKSKANLKRGAKNPESATMHDRETNGRTDKIAADKFGVSARTVAKATNILKHGCPQLQQAVREKRVNVTLAEKVAKTLEGDEQQEAVAVAMVSE